MDAVVSGTAGMGLLRAVRAGDDTLLAARQGIPIPADTPLTQCFCTQARSRDAVLLVLWLDYLVTFVV